MLSALLRSGDIKDYTALGQDGMAVYTVASQLRDAIKFKRGKNFADYLAIPQRNDQGNKIDWYVPFESNRPDGQYLIVPWTSASIEERQAALTELNIFERTILELGQELAKSQSSRGDQLIFSRLLCGGDPNNLNDTENLKALRFPNPDHVYLVNDRPVITFWGFAEKHTSLNGSPFLQLQPATINSSLNLNSSSVAGTLTSTGAAGVTLPNIDMPDIEINVNNNTTNTAEKPHPCKQYWWSIPLTLLGLALLAWFLRGWWWPTPKVTLNLGSDNAPSAVVGNSLIPAVDCEERRVAGKSYYYWQQQWVDSEGKLVENQPLLTQINQTSPFGTMQCDNIEPLRRFVAANGVSDRTGIARVTPTGGALPTGNGALPAVDSTLPAGDASLPTPDSALPATDGALPTADNSLPTENSAAPTNDALPPVDPNMAAAPATNPVNEESAPAQGDKDVTQPTPQSGDNTLPPVDPNMDNPLAGSTPQGGQGLTIPADSLQNGNLDFLNGKWRAGAGIQDKTTGKPLRLEYSFSDGLGQVKVTRGDGVQCVGDVSAKMQSGGLNLNSAGAAKCSDGSTYQLPAVSCKPGARSVADCQGAYSAGQRFPISMKAN